MTGTLAKPACKITMPNGSLIDGTIKIFIELKKLNISETLPSNFTFSFFSYFLVK